MHDIELPLGRRTTGYRLLEMLPALVTLGIPASAIILTLVDPRLGAAFVAVFVAIGVLRAARGAVDSVRGYRRLRAAERTDWGALAAALDARITAEHGTAEHGGADAAILAMLPRWAIRRFAELLGRIRRRPGAALRPGEIVHAVIIAAYAEPAEVVAQSIASLLDARLGAERLVVVLAHEARGGPAMRGTAARLAAEHGHRFRAFLTIEHPAGLPGEVPGKGGNITHAGRGLLDWVVARGIDPERVLVTTLDCDNRVDPRYFDAVSCEFACAPDRRRVAFQPISVFTGNIWHAPAPTRLVAAGNSLWNLIATVRPLALRNFASHTQPLAALAEMDFWSRRTIVEDGHQYWRSYFHFRGRYRVVPVHLPIQQDAVLADSLGRTLLAQFRQLCRWAYGASDVPYVGVRLFGRRRPAPFWPTLRRFLQLLESHVTLAILTPMLAFGAWLPVLALGISAELGFGHARVIGVVALLPEASATAQRVALLGLVAAMVLSALLLPARPPGVGGARWIGMTLQWALLPVTLFAYTSMTAVVSQLRLLVGAYRVRFVVTEKSAAPRDPTGKALTGTVVLPRVRRP
ncbi:glycosyltransferase family 2 protein [Leucobacter allii]|uniref:Glycosyltransferase family 2 protein n=1 Tax=Leucobacter allii TaxID=2932247 RepID=A0ABY4FQY9_9MICO|nr:glycosyltransferase family 2 protein [Leucobacter allii]UOQ58706.1 glycosyltransferase family 2 protein [Leucobacter allii]